MAEKSQRDPVAPPPEAGPDSPVELGRRSWWQVLRRTVKQFSADNLGVWAAALTYYGMLSLFPGLLVLTALLGLISGDLIGGLVDDVKPIMPGPVQQIFTTALQDVRQSPHKAGVAAVVGLVVATWSASGYIDAFMKASNAIYDVPEGRPLWKRLPIRLGVTVVTGLLLVVCTLIVVLGGRLADTLGNALGMSGAAVTTWKIIKWPILILLVALLFAILYWASPNARQGGFRWTSPGGLVAVILWIAVSVAFGFYAANFASYAATYGALGGIIVFLIWLWLTNMAILLGAEFDAELERERAIAAGHPAEEEPYLRMRDDRAVDDRDRSDL